MKTELKLGGTFHFEHIRDGKVIDEWDESNLVVDEGLTYILGNALDGTTASLANWYIGIYGNDYTPQNVLTAATVSATAGELTTEYSEATRAPWVEAGVSNKAIGNDASAAAFTFTPASTNVYGAFLISDSGKGATTGTLCAAARFSSLRVMLITDILNVTYSIAVAAA